MNAGARASSGWSDLASSHPITLYQWHPALPRARGLNRDTRGRWRSDGPLNEIAAPTIICQDAAIASKGQNMLQRDFSMQRPQPTGRASRFSTRLAFLFALVAAGPTAGQSNRVIAPSRSPDLALHCIGTTPGQAGNLGGAWPGGFYIWLTERVCGFGDRSAAYPCNISEFNLIWTTEATPQGFSRYSIDRVTGAMISVHGQLPLQWQCSKVTPQTKKF